MCATGTSAQPTVLGRHSKAGFVLDPFAHVIGRHAKRWSGPRVGLDRKRLLFLTYPFFVYAPVHQVPLRRGSPIRSSSSENRCFRSPKIIVLPLVEAEGTVAIGVLRWA